MQRGRFIELIVAPKSKRATLVVEGLIVICTSTTYCPLGTILKQINNAALCAGPYNTSWGGGRQKQVRPLLPDFHHFQRKTNVFKVNIIFTIAVIMFIILALVMVKVIGISIISDHNVEKNIPGVKSVTPTLHFHCNSKSEKYISSWNGKLKTCPQHGKCSFENHIECHIFCFQNQKPKNCFSAWRVSS